MSEGSSSRRGRGTVDPNQVPIGLWLGAIIALAAAAAAAYFVLGRDEPTPPHQGAALTIGDATTALLTAQEVGGGLVEPAEDDDPGSGPTLSDVDEADQCAATLEAAGLRSWDPLATESDPLARRVLVGPQGAASHQIDDLGIDLDTIRDAIGQCGEVGLVDDTGATSATLTVGDASGDAASVGDDRLIVAATVTDGDAPPRTTRALLWEREGLVSVIAASGPLSGGPPPLDDARTAALAVTADGRLTDALAQVA